MRLRQFEEEPEAKPGRPATPAEYRTPYERDRDRVLYSSAFRRLAGVTQVAAAHERQLLHNRLTHSLKVGQIGRRLAQRVIHPEHGNFELAQYIDPDVVETAGLAHDLGHPPFGHSAEVMLDGKLAECGGFEGNAQSFRIVTKLSVLRGDYLGLNLTGRSLNAILKYPNRKGEQDSVKELRKAAEVDEWWNRSYGKKWGTYLSEGNAFIYARESYRGRRDVTQFQRSPEAIIMDWADDISFATHDIEDYFRAGLIPLHSLEEHAEDISNYAAKSALAKEPAFSLDRFDASLQRLNLPPIERSFRYERVDRLNIHDFVSTTISSLVDGLTPLEAEPWVAVSETAQYTAEYLKTLTRYFVIDSAPTAVARKGQVHVLEELFDRLFEWVKDDPDNPRTPSMLRGMLVTLRDEETFKAYGENEERLIKIAVVDYLCSLTEAQVMDLAQRFDGSAPASMFGAWF